MVEIQLHWQAARETQGQEAFCSSLGMPQFDVAREADHTRVVVGAMLLPETLAGYAACQAVLLEGRCSQVHFPFSHHSSAAGSKQENECDCVIPAHLKPKLPARVVVQWRGLWNWKTQVCAPSPLLTEGGAWGVGAGRDPSASEALTSSVKSYGVVVKLKHRIHVKTRCKL